MPIHRSLRQQPCSVDHSNFKPVPEPKWELHHGSVQLFIVGPGEDAWCPCSEANYSGTIGTPEEREIARKALAILNRYHLHDPDTRPADIRKIIERVSQPLAVVQ